MASRLSKTTIDHEEIRHWAEERGGQPAEVKGTERGGTGIIRIDFPGYSGEGKLSPISWDEFFDKFEESNLALVYQDVTARGQRSNFNKLVARESVDLETGNSKARPPRRATKRATVQGERRAPTAAAARTARTKTTAAKERGGSAKKTGARSGVSKSRGKGRR
jgi:hypothetical protein